MKERENIRRQETAYRLKMNRDTYYVWVGGSCNYNVSERPSGGAYVMQTNEETVETFVISADHTTEFRMILSVMIHAMDVVPEGAEIVFLTNVSYIHQNYDKAPTDKTANADLINECIQRKQKHKDVTVKLVPFHKYHMMARTHELAHEAMVKHEPDKNTK